MSTERLHSSLVFCHVKRSLSLDLPIHAKLRVMFELATSMLHSAPYGATLGSAEFSAL